MTGGFLSVPIMRPYHRWTILHVSILAGLLLTLNADSQNSTCDIEIRVRRSTVYEAVPGKDLQINCPVAFCNNSPPTVSWYKYETTTPVPVDVSSSSHIKTRWTPLKPLEGISYLIFQKILRNNSGEYRCQTGDSVSHKINVSVDGIYGENNVTQNDTKIMVLDPESPRDNLWMIYMYFAAGIVPFVIIVIILSIVSMRGCKGESRDTPDLSHQPSHDALTTTTIYENVK